jgi:putative membrane protein
MHRLLSCLIIVLPAIAWSADKSPDQDFFKHAAEGGIAEVEAGKLAQSKGSSQAVKDFGALMVKDHTDANAKLKSVAASEGVDLPSSSSATQMASKAKLEVLTGETFDKAYIKNQVAAHEQTVSLFKKEIASGSDAQAKAFAKETLPTVQAHLRKIRDIAAQSGVETK